MIIEQIEDLHLNKKRIWQTKIFFLIIIVTLLLLGQVVFWIMVPPMNAKVMLVEGALLIVTIAVEGLLWGIATRSIRIYNEQIKTGVVLVAKVNKLIIHDMQGIDIEASYFDSNTGRVYRYKEYDWTIANRIFYPQVAVYANVDLKRNPEEHPYIKQYPYVYVLVSKNNYNRGYILIREYLEGIPNTQTVDKLREWEQRYGEHQD